MKELAARIGRPKPGKRRKEHREEKPYQGPKMGCATRQSRLGDGKLFGFAIEFAGHHQVKPNKNRPLID
ncbi:hypothetical protein ACEUAI_09390 [Aeromonas veronii]